MTIDYIAMQVGDRTPMPVKDAWEGENQALYQEVQAYCQTLDPAPQYEVETIRKVIPRPGQMPEKQVEFWLHRIR